MVEWFLVSAPQWNDRVKPDWHHLLIDIDWFVLTGYACCNQISQINTNRLTTNQNQESLCRAPISAKQLISPHILTSTCRIAGSPHPWQVEGTMSPYYVVWQGHTTWIWIYTDMSHNIVGCFMIKALQPLILTYNLCKIKAQSSPRIQKVSKGQMIAILCIWKYLWKSFINIYFVHKQCRDR